ncbi:MAG: ATP-dependent DNA helicase [Nitrospirota bacterium]
MDGIEERNRGEAPALAGRAAWFLKEVVGSALDDYEIRHSQVTMMGACAGAIEEGGMLLAEAGTGTGKTFAYLIPLLLSGKRATISTRTINLQEQIVTKDLSLLASLREFDYAIAKGRSNYLCLRRLAAFRTSDDNSRGEYHELVQWGAKTETGDREEWGALKAGVWDAVSSDADACKGAQCGFFRDCFYFKARQQWGKARIVVANHALVGINALLERESRLLPETEVLIVDEAHALDSVLSEVAGVTLAARGFDRIFSTLLRMDERGAYKGILSNSPHLFPAAEGIKTAMGELWMRVRRELGHRETVQGTCILEEPLESVASSLRDFTRQIQTTTVGLFLEDDELELKAAIGKLTAFADGMEVFAEGMPDSVRWAEIEERNTALRMAPVYPKDFVRNNLLPDYRSAIFTSATLSVSGDFGFIGRVLGLEDARTITVPSPFDLSAQVSVDIRREIDPRDVDNAEKLAAVVLTECAKRDGGVLVLFTSRETMKRTWELAAGSLEALGLNPMLQGELPNRTMLEIMRESRDSIIFGLDSFWEGVDVKGDALKCLIITKLPFEVPTEPIVRARTEEIEKSGGNAFYAYSLPRAVLKFKQGFGRLIRSGSDRGRVVICDGRIKTRAYGRTFMESLYR